jgi:hypothetical protein
MAKIDYDKIPRFAELPIKRGARRPNAPGACSATMTSSDASTS